MSQPVIIAKHATVLLNQQISARDLFGLGEGTLESDISTWHFQDINRTLTSGYFRLNGVAIPQGQQFSISTAELDNLVYVGGNEIKNERIRVFVRDLNGLYSDWELLSQVFTARPNNNNAPVARAHNFTVLANEFVLGTELASGFDPDGYHIQKYRIRDLRVDNGRFEVDGVAQAQGQFFEIDATDLGRLRYTAIGARTSELFEVSVYDGVQWSPVATAQASVIPNASAPVVRFVSTSILGTATINLVATANVIDADQNTIKKFIFVNTSTNPAHGEIVFKGVVQPRQTQIEVSPEDFGDIMFVAKNANQTQTINYAAYDGRYWSLGIDRIQITSTYVIPPTKPVFKSVGAGEFYDSQRVNRSVSAMFAKQDAGIPYVSYQVLDPTTAAVTGHFALGGVPLPAGSIQTLTAQQFNNLQYVTAGFENYRRETIYVRANNGQFWGDWEKVDITTYPEIWNTLNSGSSWFDQPMFSSLPVNGRGQRVLSYSFMQEFPDYETGEAIDGDPLVGQHFSSFTEIQRFNTRLAFEHLEEILNVQFVEIADTATNVLGQRGGIFRFGEYGIPSPPSSAAAFAFFPGPEPYNGDSWYNRLTMPQGINLDYGQYGFTVLLHEMGHTLGLKHPHDGFGRLPPSVDTDVFTQMSYNSDVTAWTYQLYDIHQLQRQYGANMSHNVDGNTYNMNLPGTPTEWTLWDAGGNDTISNFGSNNASTIDLRQGMRTSFGGGLGIRNMRLAIGTNIENAIGGNGVDIVYGNHLDNMMTTHGGNDILIGGRGDDLLRGGAGDDRYIFGVSDGFDVISEAGLGGQDTLIIGQVTSTPYTPHTVPTISGFPGLTLLQDDFIFRKVGNDLAVDLRLNRGDSQGIVRIKDHYLAGSEIETLEFNGTRVDLVDLGDQITSAGGKRFQLTANSSANGFLAALV